jgi:lipid A 3-O-deacylase
MNQRTHAAAMLELTTSLVFAGALASTCAARTPDVSLAFAPPTAPSTSAAASPTPAPAPTTPAEATSLSLQPKPSRRYLDAGGLYLTFGGGVANDFSEATDSNAFFQVSTFVAPRFELGGEVGGWYFSQRGRDTPGASVALSLKYHFLPSDFDLGEPDDRTLTFFGEIGAGVLFSSLEVPDGGTHTNFLPRAGGGLTYAITEDARLVAGVRWHHISNARISSNSSNPSRDGVMVYVGVTFELP